MYTREYGRKIFSRWIVIGNLKLVTATCIAGSENSLADISFLKDSKTGFPMITGSTLAGAMRSLLKQQSNEDCCKLFGADKNDPDGNQSPLIVYDSICECNKKEECLIEYRDGVKIDSKRGISDNNFKFDYEVISKDTIFPILLELIVSDEQNEKRLIIILLKLLNLLFKGKLSLGYKKNRGLGLTKLTNCGIKRFSLHNKKECLDWLCSDYNKIIPDNELDITSIFDFLRNKTINDLKINITDIQYHNSEELDFSAKFAFPQGFLIKSSGKKITDPDIIYLTSHGKPIVSGTSLAGVLRHQALRIANTVRKMNNHKDAEDWVNLLFGNDKGKKGKASASLIKVSENSIKDNYVAENVKRIQIDRFTQGVMSHALFDEDYIQNGNFDVDISMKNSKKESNALKGFFLLIIKDLIEGLITIGSSASIGRGRIEVIKASEKLFDGDKERKLWDNEAKEDTKWADEMIKAFIEAKELNS